MTNIEIEGLEHTLVNRKNKKDTFTVCVERSATFDGKLAFDANTFTSILGESGCGKTTLLAVIGLLREPFSPSATTGWNLKSLLTSIGLLRKQDNTALDKIKTFNVCGENVKELWKYKKISKIEQLRREYIGFALQDGELLPALTVKENITVPLRLNRRPNNECENRAKYLIEAFGLIDHKAGKSLANRRIVNLSGGQRQRVVLARAIAHSPQIVFVDEPTSALDKTRAREALNILKGLEGGRNTTVVMISHDRGLAVEFSDTIIEMAPGEVEGTGEIKSVTPTKLLYRCPLCGQAGGTGEIKSVTPTKPQSQVVENTNV